MDGVPPRGGGGEGGTESRPAFGVAAGKRMPALRFQCNGGKALNLLLLWV